MPGPVTRRRGSSELRTPADRERPTKPPLPPRAAVSRGGSRRIAGLDPVIEEPAVKVSDRVAEDLVSLSEQIDTTTASGKMVFRMLAVLAEFERDLISERTRAAMATKRANGQRVGAVPFGCDLAAASDKNV